MKLSISVLSSQLLPYIRTTTFSMNSDLQTHTARLQKTALKDFGIGTGL